MLGLRWLLGGAALLGPARACGGGRQADAAQPGALPVWSTTSTWPTPWPTATAAWPGSPPCAAAWPTRGRSCSCSPATCSARACSASTTPAARWSRRSTPPSSTTPPSATTSSSCRSTRWWPGSPSPNFKWISSNCAQGRRHPVRQGPALGHGPGLGPQGRPLRAHAPGRLPEGLSLHRPRQRGASAIDTLVAQGAELIVGLTHQTIEADRDLLAREPRLDLILGGHEHEAHDSVVSGRHVLKADANSRTAQFVTLWGGKGQVAAGGRAGQDRQPAARRHRRGARSSRAGRTACAPGSGRSAWSGAPRVPDRRARRDRPAAGVARSATWSTDAMRAGTGTDVALLNAGHAPARRRHPAGTAQQLPARIDLPLRRRDPGRHRARSPGRGSGRSWSTAWPTGSLGQGRVPAGLGRLVHLRSGRARRAAGSRARFVGRLAASSGPATRSGWRFRSIRRATEATATTCPRPRGLRGPGVGAPGGGPPGAVRRRLAGGPGRRPAGRPDRAGWKHKSRLSRCSPGPVALADFDHPGRKAEIPGAPKGYAALI